MRQKLVARASTQPKQCITQWEALAECITREANPDVECHADNELAPKAGVCTPTHAALNRCIGIVSSFVAIPPPCSRPQASNLSLVAKYRFFSAYR